MNAYAYIVPIDDGAAPNPYGGVCTLALCKPNLRKIAQVGDWIFGLENNIKQNRLIYAMKITQVMSMQAYDTYTKEHLPIKIPNVTAPNIEKHMGDSVYDFSNHSINLRKSVHSRCTKAMDLAGKNVLLSSHFYYFGSMSKKLPQAFENRVNLEMDFILLNQYLHEKIIRWMEEENFELNKLYAAPKRVGILNSSTKESERSCCIRKKIEKKFIQP